MDINSSEEFKKNDAMGVEKSLSLFPDQIKESWRQAQVSDIPQIFTKSILVSGMGGSGVAARMLQSVFEENLDYPFEVWSDYGLPAWVSEDTLVVANSFSGNTEETLSAVEEAGKIGTRIMGIATGGKIGEMIKSKAVTGVVITKETNPSGLPKTGLGLSLGALAGSLAKAGILPLEDMVITEAVRELVSIRETWEVKEMSRWLHGSAPVLFGGKPLVGALNAGRNAMCELSRSYTQFYDFPDINHVLTEALQKPDSAKNNKYIFFDSMFNHPRVRQRYEITKKILDEMGLEHKTCQLKSKSKFGQAIELAHYCGWLGFYLSMLDDTDPGPEPWILKLKDSLAQPLH